MSSCPRCRSGSSTAAGRSAGPRLTRSFWRWPGGAPTCVLTDPATKGGSESTGKIANADLVPTDTNLADEKRSVAISSNLHPAAFNELMPETLATATVDRLRYHAHVCQTTGDSVRLTQASPGRESAH